MGRWDDQGRWKDDFRREFLAHPRQQEKNLSLWAGKTRQTRRPPVPRRPGVPSPSVLPIFWTHYGRHGQWCRRCPPLLVRGVSDDAADLDEPLCAPASILVASGYAKRRSCT